MIIRHAGIYMQSVDGAQRCYGTLCGLIGGEGSDRVTNDPDNVTCKKCRKSVAFRSN